VQRSASGGKANKTHFKHAFHTYKHITQLCDVLHEWFGILESISTIRYFDIFLSAGWGEQDHRGKPFSNTYHRSRYLLGGQDLADGHVGVYSETRGDWKYLVELLALTAYYACNAVCHLCRASKKIRRLWYTSVGRRARHRQTLYTNSQFHQWFSSLPPSQRSPMLDVEGFDIWRTWVDWMHSSDLGLLAIIIPSVMWELTGKARAGWSGSKRNSRMDRAWEDYCDWCRANHVKNKAFRFRAGRFFIIQ